MSHAVTTKSGKSERVHKLPSGAKVSLNLSEEATLADMSIRKVADVQAALGIPGKRNNLKGMGAKNVLSFDTGAGGDDATGDEPGDESSPGPAGTGDAPGDETSDEGYGFTGQQGYGVSTSDDAGLGGSWGQAPPSVAETAATEDIGTTPTPTATEATAATEDIGAKANALTAFTLASLAKDAIALNPIGLAVTGLGWGLNQALSGKGTTDETADPDTTMGPTPADPGQDDEADEPVDTPSTPDDDIGGSDYIPPRRAVVRAASNNTTLAIAENEDIGGRKNLRRARRQITRFA
jgi:hypothetical protein